MICVIEEDEGQFYRTCEKLDQILRQNGAYVQNHLLEGRYAGAFIRTWRPIFIFVTDAQIPID